MDQPQIFKEFEIIVKSWRIRTGLVWFKVEIGITWTYVLLSVKKKQKFLQARDCRSRYLTVGRLDPRQSTATIVLDDWSLLPYSSDAVFRAHPAQSRIPNEMLLT